MRGPGLKAAVFCGDYGHSLRSKTSRYFRRPIRGPIVYQDYLLAWPGLVNRRLECVRDPVLRPGQFRFIFDPGEGLEANLFAFTAQVVKIAAHRQRHGPAACSLVEDVNTCAGITQPLAGDKVQKRRFTRASGTGNDRVPNVALVQRHSEWS